MWRPILIALFALFNGTLLAYQSENWVATLSRPDGKEIVFNFTLYVEGKSIILTVINGSERIEVSDIRFSGDSVFFQMPVFESSFRAHMKKDNWVGTWTKGGSSEEQVMPFKAVKSDIRFDPLLGNVKLDISGRWAVRFANDSSSAYPSVAEFRQQGNRLTGTILTPTGDYRYLEGIVTGNQLKLSTFDGGHAFLFTAIISDKKTLSAGKFYSGATYVEDWYAVRNKQAIVNTEAVSMAMQPGETRLNFRFPDLNGDPVSILDDRFKNKVVIVQVMGSWCPNCMDETAFLSNYYRENKNRGVEVIALAYEYSTDFERSAKSLRKFQERFDVQYPMLITGVKVSDSLRTEKTLPQVTPIRFFPSSIIIDKKGVVRKFDTAFVGPGTGKAFEEYSRNFYAYINRLLNE